MRKFLCVMLFVVCLVTLSACSVGEVRSDVVEVFDWVANKLKAVVRICRPYLKTALENMKILIKGILGR